MAPFPAVRYFLSSPALPLNSASPQWHTPLPVGPNTATGRENAGVKLGNYLEAVREFLQQEDFRTIRDAVSRKAGRSVSRADISEIRIISEKHGEFYHPVRVETVIEPDIFRFVVNGAVSRAGRRILDREFDLLAGLGTRYPAAWIPGVYRRGSVPVQGMDEPAMMFLGEWFHGFHEFHLSSRAGGRGVGVRVWHPDRSDLFLNRRQEHSLYRSVAAILTFYYDHAGFAQIYPWHHAAGDFVVHLRGGGVSARLVTVRQYAPMIAVVPGAAAVDIQMDAALLFFMNLSIRMRLDRHEGTGASSWAGPAAAAGTIEGFFRGLSLQVESGRLSKAESAGLRSSLRGCSASDLMAVGEMIFAAQPAEASDTPLIQKHLQRHVAEIRTALSAA